MMHDIKGWFWMGLAVAAVLAIAVHDPMVIVVGFAALGFLVFVFAAWMLWRLFARPSPRPSSERPRLPDWWGM